MFARVDAHTPMVAPSESLAPIVDRTKGLSAAAIERITEKVSPERIAQEIANMLEANLSNDKPDWRAREIAIKLWLSYTVGLPTQRTETTVNHVSTQPTVEQLLRNPDAIQTILRTIWANPEGRAMMVRMVEEWKAGAIDV